ETDLEDARQYGRSAGSDFGDSGRAQEGQGAGPGAAVRGRSAGPSAEREKARSPSGRDRPDRPDLQTARMTEVIEFLKSLYNAERLLELVRTLLASPFGLTALFGIVFAETGLLVGFFLPGDSLLFSVGVASGAAGINVYLLAGMLMCAAIIGDN